MSKRTEMLGSVVRSLIAPILRECPRECGIVSLTRIDVSADASYATVFVTALRQPESALDFLHNRRKDLQKKLSTIPRRKVPVLRFRLDREMEQSNRLDELLGRLEN